MVFGTNYAQPPQRLIMRLVLRDFVLLLVLLPSVTSYGSCEVTPPGFRDFTANGRSDIVPGTVGGQLGLTLSVWVKRTRSGSAWDHLVWLSSASGDNIISVHFQDGMRYDVNNNGETAQLTANGAFPVNTWTHVAIVHEREHVSSASGRAKMFWDGALVANQANKLFPLSANRDQSYAGYSHNQDPLFEGEMRDMLLWDAALTEAELAIVRSDGFVGADGHVVAAPIMEEFRSWCGVYCPCLSSYPSSVSLMDSGELGVVISGTQYAYPSSYGLSNCTAHDFGLQPSCTDPSRPSEYPTSFCYESWCYVDPSQCNVESSSTAYVPGTTLHYSYASCDTTVHYSSDSSSDSNSNNSSAANDNAAADDNAAANDNAAVVPTTFFAPPTPALPAPSPPGSATVTTVVATFTLAGTVEAFDETPFKTSLASTLGGGIEPTAISLSVTSASVRVDATILAPSAAVASTAMSTLTSMSAAWLSASLGVTVEAVTDVSSQNSQQQNSQQQTSTSAGSDNSMGMVIGAVIGGVVIIGIIVCILFMLRKRGGTKVSATAAPAQHEPPTEASALTDASNNHGSMKVLVATDITDDDGAAIDGATSERVVASLSKELSRIVMAMPDEARVAGGKFEGDVRSLVFGRSEASVLPITHFMCVSEQQVNRASYADDTGLSAIEAEFEEHGTPEDKECFQYVRHGKTGDSDKLWANGRLDEGRPVGLDIMSFVEQPECKAADLTAGMVLALRLYTTACYKSLNNPLRGLDTNFQPRELSKEQPHPFPVTVHLLTEGIKRLRAVEGGTSTKNDHAVLWRGLRNLKLSDAFLSEGGSEKAPMSTSRSLEVAVRYSASANSVLLKLETSNFRERGADLTFLSAFPGEREVLYPPLTHLAPGRTQQVKTDGGVTYTVVEVKPSFG